MEAMKCRYTYCIFCRTGAEKTLSEEIGKRFGDVCTLTAVQEKHKFINRRYEIDRRVFLPGYLFLYSEKPIDFEALLRMESIYRILGDEASAHELSGGDRSFAEWLYRNNGLIGISRIRISEGKIRILSGPMKYFGRQLIRLDKHTKNALIRMDFLGTVRDMWLAFEFEDGKSMGKREGEKR